MGIILVIFVVGIGLILLSKLMGHEQAAKAEELNRLQTDYKEKLREAHDEFRKEAIRKYTEMGMGEFIPHMVIEDDVENGEFLVKFVGLNDDQQARMLKLMAEHQDECELLGIENQAQTKVVKESNTININTEKTIIQNSVINADKIEVDGHYLDIHDNNVEN